MVWLPEALRTLTDESSVTDLPRLDLMQSIRAVESPQRARNLAQCFLGLGLIGLAARVVVVMFSIGSNDMTTWREFAEQITRTSVGQLYDEREYFNHPPLMGFLASGLCTLSQWSGIRFEYLFKAPMLLADVASGALLYHGYKPRGEVRAALVFALFCCNPVSILITAYHGNTDSLCASLALLAAVLMDARRAFWSGLALAAAINVKLIPVLLIVPLASCVRDRKGALTFLAGLSVGVIPFVPYLLGHWHGFYEHVLAYRSNARNWGITYSLFKLGSQVDGIGKACRTIARFWIAHGHWAVLAWPVVLAVVKRFRRPGWSARELAQFTLLGFLVLTPGWGVQYLVYPVALVFAVSVEQAVLYSLVNGLFAFLLYAALWSGEVPLYSNFFVGLPPQPLLFGVVVWLVVARMLYDLMRPELQQPGQRSPLV
jgi:Glycosyltransferase family 87